MAHKMILVSPCLTKVYAAVVATKKNAGVAQVEERQIRNLEGEASNASTGPRIEE